MAAGPGADRPLHGLSLVRQVLALAAVPSFEQDLRRHLEREGVVRAVEHHDTARLFDWLMVGLSLRGISDRIALDYIATHGSVRYQEIAQALGGSEVPCPKLVSFAALRGCGYRKLARTCAAPELLPGCPLPRHSLRNGHLNQAAYGLFLFLREVCGGDLVGWLDTTLAAAGSDDPDRLGAALLAPLRAIPGVGDKLLSMLLADLLIGADPSREQWVAVGRAMVAVDSLVHAFLHRTGLLAGNGAAHRYGPACYRPEGCAGLIRRLAAAVDARTVNPAFPARYPRLLQHAIWRYGAADGLDLCNGNRIDDRAPCANQACRLYPSCARLPLHPPSLAGGSEVEDGPV